MEFTLESFVNERYILLNLLYKNQVKVKDAFYIPLSQQEIADIAHISKLKTNIIISELINLGCIFKYQNKRGKYAITDRGYKVLQIIQKMNVEQYHLKE